MNQNTAETNETGRLLESALLTCEIQGELIDYGTGRPGLRDFYPGTVNRETGQLSLDRGDREVSLFVKDGKPFCCIRLNGAWDRYPVTREGVAVLTPDSVKLVIAAKSSVTMPSRTAGKKLRTHDDAPVSNLANCVTIKNMSAVEAAQALAMLASKITGPVGLGIWEGSLSGVVSGNTHSGEHIAVFRKGDLIAPFGPRGDAESEACAALFALALTNAAAIAAALSDQ